MGKTETDLRTQSHKHYVIMSRKRQAQRPDYETSKKASISLMFGFTFSSMVPRNTVFLLRRERKIPKNACNLRPKPQ